MFSKYKIFPLIVIMCLIPVFARAADPTQNQPIIEKAQVLQVLTAGTETLPGTSTITPTQSLEAEIINGSDTGKTVVFDNDYVMLKKGDVFYLSATVQPDGSLFYSVSDPDRLPVLISFLIIFIALVLIFGGMQGLRGLLSLAGSMLLIVFVLLPGMLHGYSPLLVSIAVSSLIIILGSYITHGFNKTTSAAVISMILTVIITGFMAYFAVYHSHLTGATGDEAISLNFDIKGGIDLVGVLMGGIIIGLLGVLYDVSIGQAISVEELHHIAPQVNKWQIYKRAIRIGREHIGALVNTLAIAYVGVSLPLLLLFYSSANSNFVMMVNREVFATEIIRILIGSIGLILAVPITTLIAVYLLMYKNKKDFSEENKQKETLFLKNFPHKH